MLCVLRYEEDHLGDARNEDQVPKYTDEEARRRRPLKVYSGRTSGPWPGYPAPEGPSKSSKAAAAELQEPDIRPRPGHPAQPEHPAHRPEIRPEDGQTI